MDSRGYSILICPLDGVRMRRIPLSRFALRTLAVLGLIAVTVNAYLFGAYLWLKLERQAAVRMKAEAEQQKTQLVKLYDQAEDMQRLLAKWKGLKASVRASLSPRQRASVATDPAVGELEAHLASVHQGLAQMVASIPADWPVEGRVSSGVGPRISPWTGEREFHTGVDIPRPVGTPVRAPGSGVVKLVGRDRANGRLIVPDHGDGIDTRYAHLSRIHVEEGVEVQKGQWIADVGSTGRSTGPHLHYEVRVDGTPIDPRRHLLKKP